MTECVTVHAEGDIGGIGGGEDRKVHKSCHKRTLMPFSSTY